MYHLKSVVVSCCLLSLPAISVAEQIDSLGVAHGYFHDVTPEAVAPAILPDAGEAPVYTDGVPYAGMYAPPSPQVNPLAYRLPSLTVIPGTAILRSWNNGTVYASGNVTDMPGMMGIETGSLGINQQFGQFTVSFYGEAIKYGYFRGLSTSYGFGGSATYNISRNLGITVFGAFYTDAGINRPAMTGYVNAPVFGGYINWRFHDHWGVKAGVQSIRSIAYGRWETRPIVMPYYRTKGGAELGIDLGGILYEVIRAASGNSWGGYGNPSMPRPDFGPPPVAPRN